jgi:biopolymer transport protein ExbD
METLVKQIYSQPREDYIMYVKAHKDLQYVKVVDALDRLSKSGVRVAALITEQKPGTESLVESDRIKPGAKK